MVTGGTASQNIAMYVVAPEDEMVCAYVADYVLHPSRRLSETIADILYRNDTERGVDMCPSSTELLPTTE